MLSSLSLGHKVRHTFNCARLSLNTFFLDQIASNPGPLIRKALEDQGYHFKMVTLVTPSTHKVLTSYWQITNPQGQIIPTFAHNNPLWNAYKLDYLAAKAVLKSEDGQKPTPRNR